MWTIAASNKKFNGPLGSYNGLTDVHLAHYFSRPFRQGHLKAARLITNDGLIIPEQKVKVASFEYEKQKRNCDNLASSVIQNAIHKKGSWKKKLCSYIEDIIKIENVEQIKAGPKNNRNDFPCENTKENLTVPFLVKYNMNHLPIKEDYVKNASTFPRLVHSACACFKDGLSLQANSAKLKRCFSAKEISPYTTTWLNSSYYRKHSNMHHVKRSQRKKKKSKKSSKNKQPQPLSSSFTKCTNITKLSIPDQNFKINQCRVTLYYHGHTSLNNSQIHFTEEVLIRQQHCSGTSLIIYKGPIAPKEKVTFLSLDHEDFPFSIILFLDGIRSLKLSSCCIFRYQIGKRLGGPSGVFSIQSIEGGLPCLKCQYHQMEPNNKRIKQKIEDSVQMKKEIGAVSSNITEKDVSVNSGKISAVRSHNQNSFASDAAESSVESEIIDSPTEENLEVIIDNHKSNAIGNSDEAIEDETVEDEQISVEEDFVG